jgi:hypothetical protein
MRLTIRALTPELWPALEDLFGRNGACSGCWCMYWRIGSAYRRTARERNRAAFREVVRRGPPPGLLAFDGEVAVGWCRRRGVTSALIAAALRAARRAHAPALEAYPLDGALTSSASSTGYASTFARAGFTTVARRVPARPIMRHDLRVPPRKRQTGTRDRTTRTSP